VDPSGYSQVESVLGEGEHQPKHFTNEKKIGTHVGIIEKLKCEGLSFNSIWSVV
jgi:hypothetical protein